MYELHATTAVCCGVLRHRGMVHWAAGMIRVALGGALQMKCACTLAVYVHVYIVRTWRHIADVSGAAARMQIMRGICGCGWCDNA